MLYFPCPKCGGNVESVEGDGVEYANRHVQRFARGGVTGHAHPALALLGAAVTIGRLIYKRVPGGGLKRCTACHYQYR